MPLTTNVVVRSLIALIARIIRLKAHLTARERYFPARPSQSVGRKWAMRSASGEPGCGITS